MDLKLCCFFSQWHKEGTRKYNCKKGNYSAVHVFIASWRTSYAVDKLYPFVSRIFGDDLWFCKRSTKTCLLLDSLDHWTGHRIRN